MALQAFKFFAASLLILTSIVVLIVLVLFFAGPAYFTSLIVGSVWHILGILIVTGIVRLPFRSGCLALSAICGALVAGVGSLDFLASAVSKDMTTDHSQQQTAAGHRDCKRRVSWSRSLSLGR